MRAQPTNKVSPAQAVTAIQTALTKIQAALQTAINAASQLSIVTQAEAQTIGAAAFGAAGGSFVAGPAGTVGGAIVGGITGALDTVASAFAGTTIKQQTMTQLNACASWASGLTRLGNDLVTYLQNGNWNSTSTEQGGTLTYKQIFQNSADKWSRDANDLLNQLTQLTVIAKKNATLGSSITAAIQVAGKWVGTAIAYLVNLAVKGLEEIPWAIAKGLDADAIFGICLIVLGFLFLSGSKVKP